MKVKKSTPKMSGLVVAALRNLRDAHGSTAKQIMKYIMAEYNASEVTVQRQLKTALKRGVEYGILKKTNTGYSLNTGADVIGPFNAEQVDACKRKKKRASGKPKRRCGARKKRSACPRRRKRSCARKPRRKKNPCGVCSSRGRRGGCDRPVELPVRDGTPSVDEEATDSHRENDRGSLNDNEAGERQRSRSRSKGPGRPGARSRSQSQIRSRYSGSENEDFEGHDEDM